MEIDIILEIIVFLTLSLYHASWIGPVAADGEGGGRDGEREGKGREGKGGKRGRERKGKGGKEGG